MTILNFSDGIKIDTSGELRIKKLKDGFYVIGEGCSIPCSDEDDAIEILNEMKNGE